MKTQSIDIQEFVMTTIQYKQLLKDVTTMTLHQSVTFNVNRIIRNNNKIGIIA